MLDNEYDPPVTAITDSLRARGNRHQKGNLALKLLPHVVVSTAAGGIVWAATGEPLSVPAAVAAGVLPDGDHVLDYYLRYWRGQRGRLLLLLHGWEFLALGIALYVALQPGDWAIGLLAGYFTQIGGDQLFNDVRWNTYLLTARIVNRFDSMRILGRRDDRAYLALVESLPFGRTRLKRWFEERDDAGR
jgi:hypothetical protein